MNAHGKLASAKSLEWVTTLRCTGVRDFGVTAHWLELVFLYGPMVRRRPETATRRALGEIEVRFLREKHETKTQRCI